MSSPAVARQACEHSIVRLGLTSHTPNATNRDNDDGLQAFFFVS